MKDLFDHYADSYDKVVFSDRRMRYIHELVYEKMFDVVNIRPGMKVLDVGCGTGELTLQIADRGGVVTGIDRSANMIKKAKEKTRKKGFPADFYQMDVLHADLPENHYDLIFCAFSFEFFEHRRQAFSQMLKMLKKYGTLVVAFFNADSPWGNYITKKAPVQFPVLKKIRLCSRDYMFSLYAKGLELIKYCLYINPENDEQLFRGAAELAHSKNDRPGILICTWKKEQE